MITKVYRPLVMCGKQGVLVSEQYVMVCVNEQAM